MFQTLLMKKALLILSGLFVINSFGFDISDSDDMYKIDQTSKVLVLENLKVEKSKDGKYFTVLYNGDVTFSQGVLTVKSASGKEVFAGEVEILKGIVMKVIQLKGLQGELITIQLSTEDGQIETQIQF